MFRMDGALQQGGSPPPDGLQKGTVAQRPSPERVCKDLGVAKRYCRIKVIGDTVLQCRSVTWRRVVAVAVFALIGVGFHRGIETLPVLYEKWIGP